MIQVLCFTGRGFDTCWRPASIASSPIKSFEHGPYTPIRFYTGAFA